MREPQPVPQHMALSAAGNYYEHDHALNQKNPTSDLFIMEYRKV